jgi:hypothetical protein
MSVVRCSLVYYRPVPSAIEPLTSTVRSVEDWLPLCYGWRSYYVTFDLYITDDIVFKQHTCEQTNRTVNYMMKCTQFKIPNET